MKNRFTLVMGIVLALTVTIRCEGQYSLDIDVQGPWVVYEDQHWFTVGGTETSVLVLMAPYVMGGAIDEYKHQLPGFTAGDGTWLNPGIYCVQFVSAPITTTAACSSLTRTVLHSNAAYPHNMLPVKAPLNWNWYDPKNPENSGRTYVVLPLPDDYIDDGVWWMKTGAKHDPYGANYTEQRVSLGIYLHYASISGTQVQLFGCNAPTISGTAPDGTKDCTTPVYSLINRGSVRIDMKTPANNDACDLHVRYAYPRMLKMVDYSPLYPANSSNLNAGIAFVDPATAFDESGGTYDGDNGAAVACDTDDPQNRNDQLDSTSSTSEIKAQSASGNSMAMGDTEEKMRSGLITTKSKLLDDLKDILTRIETLHSSGKACEPPKPEQPDPYFGCGFQKLNDDLKSSSMAPSYSQVELFDSLLKHSPAPARSLEGEAKPLLQSLDAFNLSKMESLLLDDVPTKNGNDCRAAIMLAR